MGFSDGKFFESEMFEDFARTEFRFADKDKNGFIDTSELKKRLEELSERCEEILPGAGRVL